jgi:hypothetical protein
MTTNPPVSKSSDLAWCIKCRGRGWYGHVRHVMPCFPGGKKTPCEPCNATGYFENTYEKSNQPTCDTWSEHSLLRR